MDLDSLLVSLLKKSSKSLADKSRIPMDGGHLIKKVAFDFYKVDNDPYSGLWKSEESPDDGKMYLVRASDPVYEKESSGDWSAISDYDKENITLAYKAVPIARLSNEDYGFDKESLFAFKEVLLEKVSSDDKFLREIISEQPTDKASAIYQSFPELNKQ
jgi:hypothetical protein